MFILILGLILLTGSLVFNVKISRELNFTLNKYLITPPGSQQRKIENYLNHFSKLEKKLTYGAAGLIVGLVLTIIGLLFGF